jgi:subtilisin family serine protease
VNITSAWNTGDTAEATVSGTSMAAPHVAGTAALYLADHARARPADVGNALVAGSSKGRVKDAGFGSPNRLLQVWSWKPPGRGTAPARQPYGTGTARHHGRGRPWWRVWWWLA